MSWEYFWQESPNWAMSSATTTTWLQWSFVTKKTHGVIGSNHDYSQFPLVSVNPVVADLVALRSSLNAPVFTSAMSTVSSCCWNRQILREMRYTSAHQASSPFCLNCPVEDPAAVDSGLETWARERSFLVEQRRRTVLSACGPCNATQGTLAAEKSRHSASQSRPAGNNQMKQATYERTYRMVPPQLYECCFINPMNTTVISTINHRIQRLFSGNWMLSWGATSCTLVLPYGLRSP